MIILAVLTVVVCLLAHAATVIAVRRLGRPLAPIVLHAVSAVGWHMVQIAWLASFGALSCYYHAAALFGLGVMGYVFAFSAVYKSVSLRVLVFLANRGMQAAKIAEVDEHVVMKSFRQRVELLLDSGLITRHEGKYLLTPAGMRALRMPAMLRSFLGTSAAGLYFDETSNRTPS